MDRRRCVLASAAIVFGGAACAQSLPAAPSSAQSTVHEAFTPG